MQGNINWLMTSEDFGANWTWTPLPSAFQAGYLECDPTDPSKLYGLARNCLATSTDKGKTWSKCNAGSGSKARSPRFRSRTPRPSSCSGRARCRSAPRTGVSWQPLNGAAKIFQYGATYDGTLSSGKTLVLHGCDRGAIGRHERCTVVWKSTDDGDTWTDETGDIVTNSPGSGVWYEKDFYLVSGGSGVMRKRGFEQ